MENISRGLSNLNNKTLIVGKGFIGQRLEETLHCPVSSKRISTFNDIQEEIKKYKPRTLINCIGYVGANNVDDCESALDETLSANTFIPLLLAEACLRNNIKLVHLSSGCIYHFDYKGQKPIQKPITEQETPDFYNLYYSRTKIYAEDALAHLAQNSNILIARLRIPLDDRPHPKNILDKLLKYKTVIDIPNSITYIPEFLKMLKHLIKIDARGIYNTVCKESLRYPELMDAYQKYVPDCQYQIMKLKELKLVRTNLILSTKKLEQTGFKLMAKKEILEECVKNYLQY